jgi:hypothetical protein
VRVERSGSVRVMIRDVSADGRIEERETVLHDLSSLERLESPSLSVRMNGAFIDAPSRRLDAGYTLERLASLTPEARDRVFFTSTGMPAATRFVSDEAVLRPADSATWAHVSLFHHTQQAGDYFERLRPGLRVPGLRLFSDVEIQVEDPGSGRIGTVQDNAAYVGLVDALLTTWRGAESLPPYDLNSVFIGHEYSHRVFNQMVLSRLARRLELRSHVNLLDALDEGLADFHGVGASCVESAGCRTRVFAGFRSGPERDSRDVGLSSCVTGNLKSTLSQEKFEGSYKLGSVFAATLYQSAQPSGKLSALQKAVVDSYSDEAVEKPGLRQQLQRALDTKSEAAFSLSTVTDSIAAHIEDADLKRRWCSLAADRLSLGCTAFPCAALPQCPADTPVTTSCQ